MLRLTWPTHGDNTTSRPVVVVHTTALAQVTAPALATARRLLAPAVLRHAEPVLCAAAEALGVDLLGQWALKAAIALAMEALEDR